jgi:hypothetical protein
VARGTRMPHRESPFALVEWRPPDRQERPSAESGGQHRQVVQDIDREQPRGAARTVGALELELVGRRLQRELRDDVVVREHQSVRRRDEAGTGRSACPRRLVDHAQLQERVLRLLEYGPQRSFRPR